MRLDPIDTGLADYQERYSLTASLVAVILGCVTFVVGVAGGFIVGLVQQAERPVLVPWSSIDEIVAFTRSGTAYSALKPFFESMSPDLERMMRGWDLDMIALQRSVWTYGPHVRILDFR